MYVGSPPIFVDSDMLIADKSYELLIIVRVCLDGFGRSGLLAAPDCCCVEATKPPATRSCRYMIFASSVVAPERLCHVDRECFAFQIVFPLFDGKSILADLDDVEEVGVTVGVAAAAARRRARARDNDAVPRGANGQRLDVGYVQMTA